MKKLEFLICGSPNDAFWSQLAMFRLGLDSLGPDYQSARLVMVSAHTEKVALPDRWKPYFRNIEIRWAPIESYLEYGDGEDYLFTLIDPSCDITFICDADTLLIREFPNEFLEDIIQNPAICGVIAHVAAPKKDSSGNDYSNLSNDTFWQELSQQVLGQQIDLSNHYTIDRSQGQCPFYINYGFVASTPGLLLELHKCLNFVQPAIRKWLDNDFYGQLGIALGVELGKLPTRTLPMRFNFPNDENAERLYPDEMHNVILIHYLRRKLFSRHKIFTDEQNFDSFMSMELTGSNAIFQKRIFDLTKSSYPFRN